jgi:hypothetical protein
MTAMVPLSDRLAAKAFALVVDPGVSADAAAATLLEMAGGSTAALHRARTRVESRLTDRPARLAESAALALRSALVAASARSDPT